MARRRRKAPLDAFTSLPVFDAMDDVWLEGADVDLDGARAEDPRDCAFAHTCQRADLDAVVYRTETHVAGMATRELIEYNAERGLEYEDVKPGAPVLVRYMNSEALRQQIKLFDDDRRTFIPGTFRLTAPSYSWRANRRRIGQRAKVSAKAAPAKAAPADKNSGARPRASTTPTRGPGSYARLRNMRASR